MKRFFIIVATLTLINAASNLEYKDDYDYEDSIGSQARGYQDAINEEEEEDDDVPEYNIKDAPKLFEQFIKTYNKQYKDAKDYKDHYKNFVSNLEYIIDFNNKEGGTSKTDINVFSDLGDDELHSLTG